MRSFGLTQFWSKKSRHCALMLLIAYVLSLIEDVHPQRVFKQSQKAELAQVLKIWSAIFVFIFSKVTLIY